MCSFCRLPVAKNHNFKQTLTFGAPVPTPFYRWGPIWCAIADPRSTHTRQISSEWVHCVGFRWAKPTILGKCWLLGAPVPTSLYRWGLSLVCYSRPKVYADLPNFVSIGLFCRPLLAKNPNFAVFWTSAFSGVAIWQQSEKVEHDCTSTNLHKQTNIQTKTQRFWPPRRRVKSEPQQTWQAAPRAHSCSSKTFGIWCIVSSLGGAENFGVTRPRQLKTRITP